MNEDDDTLRAWLLHRLPEAQAAALEERVLHDDGFGARLRAVETDLLDDYARRRLDAADRQAVARWLLATPADRARLRTAVALARAADSRTAKTRRGSTPARASRASLPAAKLRLPNPNRRGQRRLAILAFVSAAAVLLAVFGVWQRGRELRAPAATLAAANAPTITLLASLQRGAADAPSASVRIPLAAPVLRLQVEVADADVAARYTLRIAATARNVFEAHGLAAQANGGYRFLEVALAPSLLGSGDYQVSVAADGAAQSLQEWTLHTRSE